MRPEIPDHVLKAYSESVQRLESRLDDKDQTVIALNLALKLLIARVESLEDFIADEFDAWELPPPQERH